jgi:hypothetical protein
LEGKVWVQSFYSPKERGQEKGKKKEETKDTKVGKLEVRKENPRNVGEGQKSKRE